MSTAQKRFPSSDSPLGPPGAEAQTPIHCSHRSCLMPISYHSPYWSYRSSGPEFSVSVAYRSSFLNCCGLKASGLVAPTPSVILPGGLQKSCPSRSKSRLKAAQSGRALQERPSVAKTSQDQPKSMPREARERPRPPQDHPRPPQDRARTGPQAFKFLTDRRPAAEGGALRHFLRSLEFDIYIYIYTYTYVIHNVRYEVCEHVHTT